MIANNVITAVNEPTDWVNSIVRNIKEKKNKAKRKSGFTSILNKTLTRIYVESTITPVPLMSSRHSYMERSSSLSSTPKRFLACSFGPRINLLCTFNTPFGRYRLKRLPFRVKLFQRKLHEVYKDIPNVMGIADDIKVCGSTEPEHDQAFCKMFEATRKHNVNLNSEKLQFKQTKVDFFGHVLTENGIQPAKEKLEAIRNMKTPANMKELRPSRAW